MKSSVGTPETVVPLGHTRRGGAGARGPCAPSSALPLLALALGPAGEILVQELVQESLLQPQLSHRESALQDRD